MSSVETAPKTGLPFFFLIGLLLIVAGPVIYAFQFGSNQFPTPWYMPVLATVGVVMMAASVWRRGGILRILGTVFFLLVVALEWYFLLVVTRTPAYSGPAQVNTKVPDFTAKLANDEAFSSADLSKGQSTILLFFRGHW